MINRLKEYVKEDVDSIMLTVDKPLLDNNWYIIIPKDGIQETIDMIEDEGEYIFGGKVLDITEFIR